MFCCLYHIRTNQNYINMERIIKNETPLSFLTVGELKELIMDLIDTKISLSNSTGLPEVFGKKECSELTGYSIHTINKMICDKTIPYYKPGHKVIFKRDEIMAWLLKNKIETVDEFLSNNS